MVMMGIMPSTLTIASSAYTLYKFHPYIPYKLIWDAALVPGVYLLMGRLKNGRRRPTSEQIDEHNKRDFYEVITKLEEFEIVLKHLIFEDEPQIVFLGVEYVEFDKTIPRAEPIFL